MRYSKSYLLLLAAAALHSCGVTQSSQSTTEDATQATAQQPATQGTKPSQPINQAIEDMIANMTVEEKVGQMTQVTIDLILKDGQPTTVDEAKLRTALIDKKVGSILNVMGRAYTIDEWHQVITAIQNMATKDTRLKIPVLYGIDAIHGANYLAGSTLFPHNIGMAATRNPDLVNQAAKITAIETRASGIPWNFDPVLDVGRQPLWPRFEETFGEDVYVVKTMGAAAIRGYEQDNLNTDHTVASSMKHFLGYSVPGSGKDRTPSYIPEQMLREIFLPPFKAAVEAGASTVMINSGEINGTPVHGSKYYLTEILRDELGFQGVAVSDWEDVIRLHTRHRVADSPKEAVRMAVEAGLDMSMVPVDYSFYDLLVELVKEGTVSEERINTSVRRILTLKKKLGLFENAFPKAELKNEVHKPEYDKIAYQAAAESLTLLKNNNNTLPLSKNKKVLVAGPTANTLASLHGSWSYIWQGTDESQYPEKAQTVLEALQAELGKNNVISRSVADFTAAANYDVAQLKRDAQQAQAIILCLGEKAYAESPGVIDDLNIEANQIALARAAKETGKPVILVLLEGRPRIVSAIEPLVDAVVMAYRPSTFGAPALADVLSGDYNPNGVLPFTYPRYSGDVVLYDHKGTERIREDVPNTYGDRGFNPQWTFGTGLSYTTFNLSNLSVNSANFGPNDNVQVSVRVKNTGNRAGKKVVELYSHDQYASVTPSAKRLRAFTKVDLAPGEEKTVNFTITAKDLAFVNQQGKWVTEPGAFDLMVGDLKTTINYQE
ncbi:glycoside hydrolase family 3 N-terminal domain-containing protein [Pontibacter harenae]|uniref:glycoside hydrolase family 3 N-terminal domain-containing protein n=1 Tax=Pontibacter harenae TaxID=2894083 RepID=UPI001E36D0A3|nr:glycoside hydrolase family 3 N-terminal domain-containing protein [Pontibacter harenae]MCC9167018.1 glycoside hydrolase family 3 C-terminal domain-containing protein [Pontibacter harenae]